MTSKRGPAPFAGRRRRTWFAVLAFAGAMTANGADPPAHLFADGFETHAAGGLPGAPWKEETYRTGAVIQVDSQRAFDGRQSLHVLTPAGAAYRRGYVAIHLRQPLPQLQAAMFGRAMVWLDAVPDAAALHWTLLQGEGRAADDRYNAIYRLGLAQQGGTQFMANYETTPPVSTDCREPSLLRLPVRRWACIEWRFAVAGDELQFWIDGREIAHVSGRAAAATACRGHDLGGQWRAPPRFDSLYLGIERYGDSARAQELWIDDVVLSQQRVNCPASRPSGGNDEVD